jgi:hypothetical protein
MSGQNEREEFIVRQLRYCQHYDPAGITMIGGKEPHGYCKAGVVYREQFPSPDGDFGIFCRICCLAGNERSESEQRALCPRWLQRTREQAAERLDEMHAALNRMRLVGPAVAQWREKPPIGKAEVIECPACKGRLHLAQASSNGHVHGRCETPDCVSWME